MCGIAGFILANTTSTTDCVALLSAMGNAIRHRGPDDEGVWFDPESGCGLSHRRLSIIDLSPEGHQPMVSHCGRYITVFNGEIYNFLELKSKLESERKAPPWRGHSDTEVLLAAISAWGLNAAIERFNGMFAIAVWDKRERILTLARDRLGKKPVYYGWVGRSFVFASELKALRQFPDWDTTIDRGALSLHLRYGYIPAPRTIYRTARKLPAGSVLTLRPGTHGATEGIRQYWSPIEVAFRGLEAPLNGSATEVLNEIGTLIDDSVRLRRVSDVPLGVFLSGGIDSSLVAAVMQKQATDPVRTFSIGFSEPGFDEAPHAREIARYLGTDHTEFYVTASEARDVIPLLPSVYDEPFADSSQIPTYLVCKLARAHVTVALSGDGGDEGFCGYTRYVQAAQRWQQLSRQPLLLRRSVATTIESIPGRAWQTIGRLLGYRRSGSGANSPFVTRVAGFAELLSASSPQDINAFMMSYWRKPDQIVLGATEPSSVYTAQQMISEMPSVPELMMLSDLMQYLPDDILVKVDRASMAVSLEVRAPLLDYRLIEMAWRLPLAMKLCNGIGKLPLRKLLARYAPVELFERPKMGFGVPLEEWLRGPLREWADSLLDPARLRHDGLFDVTKVQDRWIAHREGAHNWAPHLWSILTVQSWLDAQHA